jgi:hypothetical protein
VKKSDQPGIALLEMAIMTMVLVPLFVFSALVSELLVERAEWQEVIQSELQELRAPYQCRNELGDLVTQLDRASFERDLSAVLGEVLQTIRNSRAGEWFELQASAAVFNVSKEGASELLFQLGSPQSMAQSTLASLSPPSYLETFFNITKHEDLRIPTVFVGLNVNLIPTSVWGELFEEFDSIRNVQVGTYIRTQVDWL